MYKTHTEGHVVHSPDDQEENDDHPDKEEERGERDGGHDDHQLPGLIQAAGHQPRVHGRLFLLNVNPI
jgi:hypothetical protein